MPADTLLAISTPSGLPVYSARGLEQILRPIAASSQTRRTVNGALVDLGLAAFRKYESVITCTDANAPSLDGVWTGMQVTVDCVAELSYLTASGSAARPVVTGSSRTEGVHTFYRPRLTMRIIGFEIRRDEWGAETGWTLELSEV